MIQFIIITHTAIIVKDIHLIYIIFGSLSAFLTKSLSQKVKIFYNYHFATIL